MSHGAIIINVTITRDNIDSFAQGISQYYVQNTAKIKLKFVWTFICFQYTDSDGTCLKSKLTKKYIMECVLFFIVNL